MKKKTHEMKEATKKKKRKKKARASERESVLSLARSRGFVRGETGRTARPPARSSEKTTTR